MPVLAARGARSARGGRLPRTVQDLTFFAGERSFSRLYVSAETFVRADLAFHAAIVASVTATQISGSIYEQIGRRLMPGLTAAAAELASDNGLDQAHRALAAAITEGATLAAARLASAIARREADALKRATPRTARLRRMPQIHLRAEEGDYAPLVLLPGDPNRARRISERFDEGSARQVNEHRGLLGFTGTYRGTPVSVQTSGMGTPSLSIVVEELLRLGVRRLIRVGTCGGIAKGLATGDLVIATAACPTDGATATYLHGEPYAPAADFALTRALVDAVAEAGITATTGLVASVDVFYNTDDDYAQRWRDRGVLAFEMEASALFFLAARAGVQAACALTVSDVLGDDITSEQSYLPLDELDRAIDRMIGVALDAGTAT
jgi:DeoD family purine-nucleoside phosphorylase